MKKINILVATAVAGAFLSGCAEFKLPELPKTEKKQKDYTEAECKKIRQKYINTSVSTSESYRQLKNDADYCERKYPGYDTNWLEKEMERQNKMK